jgi:hypothetical protein
MNRQSNLAAAAGGVLAASLAFGQGECGTVISPRELPELRALERSGIYSKPVNAGDGPVFIGLTFHVVRTSAGTGGLEQARLDQAVLDANLAYAASGIQFCQAGPTRYINSDTYYDITGTEYNPLRQIDVVPGTINCYFVRSAPFCGISSFTTSSIQGIVYNNDCVALPTNRSTFPHEIGHYFNLYHTHETAFGTECTNGSNCAAAGDLVCDTPADPNVLGNISAACLWTGSATPPCGGAPPYNPPVRNYMSYSNKDCRDHFTAQQNSRAMTTLITLRTELSRNLCGSAACYANCDGSTTAPTLNVNDFTCFLNRYASGESYANCDASTTAPVLNVNDFVCFQQRFAAGCP